mmetsp:Transcript_58591/g.189809  ORF Transcript_58591/g.189809 Transcript_58591/m.189809 type:complete len:327 (+) Transcript_58591:2-982(+)
MAARDVIGEMAGHHISQPAAARQQLFALAKEYDGVRRCRNVAVHGSGRGRRPFAATEVKATSEQQAAAAQEAAADTTSACSATASGASSGDELDPPLANGPWVAIGLQAKQVCQGKGKGTRTMNGKANVEKFGEVVVKLVTAAAPESEVYAKISSKASTSDAAAEGPMEGATVSVGAEERRHGMGTDQLKGKLVVDKIMEKAGEAAAVRAAAATPADEVYAKTSTKASTEEAAAEAPMQGVTSEEVPPEARAEAATLEAAAAESPSFMTPQQTRIIDGYLEDKELCMADLGFLRAAGDAGHAIAAVAWRMLSVGVQPPRVRGGAWA